jgi:hypothetical protein
MKHLGKTNKEEREDIRYHSIDIIEQDCTRGRKGRCESNVEIGGCNKMDRASKEKRS